MILDLKVNVNIGFQKDNYKIGERVIRKDVSKLVKIIGFSETESNLTIIMIEGDEFNYKPSSSLNTSTTYFCNKLNKIGFDWVSSLMVEKLQF